MFSIFSAQPRELAIFAVLALCLSTSGATAASSPSVHSSPQLSQRVFDFNAVRPFIWKHIGRPAMRVLKKRRMILRKRSLQCVLGASHSTGDNDEDAYGFNSSDGSGDESGSSGGIWTRTPNSLSESSSATAATTTTASTSESKETESTTVKGSFKLSKSYEGDKFFDGWDL